MTRVWFPVVMIVGLASSPARAAVVQPFELAELVDRADVIAHARVLRQHSAWEGGRIVTRTTVSVQGALKGTAGRELVVRTIGGVVDGIGQRMSGETTLRIGEEVVLFLRDLGGGEHRTVGLAQGKFRIVTHAGVSRAVQELAGLAFAKRARASGLPLEIRDAKDHKPLLSEFFARVTELVALGANQKK